MRPSLKRNLRHHGKRKYLQISRLSNKYALNSLHTPEYIRKLTRWTKRCNSPEFLKLVKEAIPKRVFWAFVFMGEREIGIKRKKERVVVGWGEGRSKGEWKKRTRKKEKEHDVNLTMTLHISSKVTKLTR